MADLAPAPDLQNLLEYPGRFPLAVVGSELGMDGVDLETVAREIGTPLYAYSSAHITARFQRLQQALKGQSTLICYAAKANSSQSILRLLGGLGAGADIVSVGELQRALAAGIPPERIVFSGVGKRDDELDAAIAARVRSINVESADELERIATRASAAGARAAVSLRINPDIDPKTHPYLATGLRASKFGIPFREGLAVADRARSLPAVELVGLACHIGSQIVDTDPFLASLERMRVLVDAVRETGAPLRHLDLGGGLGIAYAPEDRALDVEAWGAAIVEATADLGVDLVLEPGRYLVANAGILLTTVLGRKTNGDTTFVIVDAAMNDLIRPALYGGYHGIVPIRLPASDGASEIVDVVGPVCESGDFIARARRLSVVKPGDVLAILSAGAYAMAMASTYNTRPVPAEVMVRAGGFSVIRPRKTVQAMIDEERIPAWLASDQDRQAT